MGSTGASRRTNTVLKPSSSTTFASARAMGCEVMAFSTLAAIVVRARKKPTREPSVAPRAESNAPYIDATNTQEARPT